MHEKAPRCLMRDHPRERPRDRLHRRPVTARETSKDR